MPQIFGQREMLEFSPMAGKSLSTHISGPLTLAFYEMLPNAEVTAVALEYGTSPQMEVTKALRAENCLHHHGDPHDSRSQEIKAELRRVFYPDKEDWKAMVWSVAGQVVDQALAGI